MSTPGPLLTSTGRNERPGIREPKIWELISRRATRVRPRTIARQGGNLPAAVGGQLDVVRQQRFELRQVAVLGRGEEPLCELVALLARCLEPRPALLDVPSSPGRELTDVVLVLADDRRDVRIPVVEHVMQQQHRTLLGRQALQQHQHAQRQRIRDLRVLRGVIAAVGDDRLRQPFADVLFATGARGAQLVDRQPGGHGGNERARRCDLLAGIQRPMHPQQRFLHEVLGFGDAAEHPVGDRERHRPQLLEQSLPIGHAAATRSSFTTR